jgi:hypothetical protein
MISPVNDEYCEGLGEESLTSQIQGFRVSKFQSKTGSSLLKLGNSETLKL